ncbi:MAG: TRAP transporter substrate-binding protein [Sedimentibacter sp.]|uniref:TRAP transporter substrate-binding protein n=1 Tax=Sedimentibacter sp. TaxID=1960295 RepID=UPI00315969AA
MLNKKLSVLLLVGAMVTSLAACSGSSGTATAPAASGGSSAPAAATTEAKTITFAHSTAEGTSTNDAALKFKEYVEANSNGQLIVNVYPNAQLGGDRELIENTQNGTVTAMLSAPAPQVSFVPAATVFDLPFVFDDIKHGRSVLNDPEFMAAISTQYKAAGFHYLGASGQGIRTLTSNKKVTSLEDLKGLTIRTMENKFHLKTWQLLGANPTPLAFNELYTALQQGTVDAQENPIELVYSQKFFEQQKYIMNTNHILQVNCWIMNQAFYDGLTDELKAVVDEAGKIAVETANSVSDKKEPTYIETIKSNGCEFVEISDDEMAKLREKVKPVYEDIKAASDPATYDAYMAAIEEHRSK